MKNLHSSAFLGKQQMTIWMTSSLNKPFIFGKVKWNVPHLKISCIDLIPY
jgi:hypothetical protein